MSGNYYSNGILHTGQPEKIIGQQMNSSLRLFIEKQVQDRFFKTKI
jgi:hypothetical protein